MRLIVVALANYVFCEVAYAGSVLIRCCSLLARMLSVILLSSLTAIIRPRPLLSFVRARAHIGHDASCRRSMLIL